MSAKTWLAYWDAHPNARRPFESEEYWRWRIGKGPAPFEIDVEENWQGVLAAAKPEARKL